MKFGLQLLHLFLVLLRYRLDSLFYQTQVAYILKVLSYLVPRAMPDIAMQSRGERLRHALQELGPIFIKFGQILSTRPDLIPIDITAELSLLQDQVKPFHGDIARSIIEQELGTQITSAFKKFTTTPLASASIAQVHTAILPATESQPERDVVVKVLRPNIKKQIHKNILLLRNIAKLIKNLHPSAEKIRPCAIVAEIEETLTSELNLQFEGANASVLRRFWKDSPDLYIPEIIWTHSTEQVLTMERVHGIPVDDISALDAIGIDRKAAAAKSVEIFYTQVFRDNFFHADTHAGNIWLDNKLEHCDNPRFIALDFGIVGQLSDTDMYYLAENFMAIFRRDYRRIAELHIQAGWMPKHIRIDMLEAAVRTVCEPFFTRPLSKVSLAEVLVTLFKTAQHYELTVQPQLILLQKTLLNIEGISRRLDPDIDIWAIAHPVLEKILTERYSPQRIIRDLRKQIPSFLTHAQKIPLLLQTWLIEQTKKERGVSATMQNTTNTSQSKRRKIRGVVAIFLGIGLLISSLLLYALTINLPLPVIAKISTASWITGMGGLFTLCIAWLGQR